VAYDDVEKVAYLIGGKDIYVIDLSPEKLLDDGVAASTPRNLDQLKKLPQPTTVNDVAFCGDYLAVSANGATKVLPGSVLIFRRWVYKASYPLVRWCPSIANLVDSDSLCFAVPLPCCQSDGWHELWEPRSYRCNMYACRPLPGLPLRE
jgi:hypothetical protein